MKLLAALFLGVLSLAAAAIAFAPATLVDAKLADVSRGELRVSDATGTLWSGGGVLVDRSGALRIPATWRVAPWPLVRGIVAIEFAAADAGAPLRGHAELSDERVGVREFELSLPAPAITAAIGRDVAHAGGVVRLHSAAISHGRSGSSGSAAAEWVRARVVAFDGVVLDLGTVSASVAVRGNEFAGPVRATGGNVLATGNIAFDANGARIDIEVSPAPDAPAAVRQVIARLGAADARGAVRLRAAFPPR